MPGAKRQGREKPAEGEQWKVRAPEWGPQAGPAALLAGPPYKGGGQRRWVGIHTKRSPGAGVSLSCPRAHSLSLPFTSFESACPHASKMYFPLFSKTDLSKNYNTDCPRAVTRRGL